MRQPVYYSHLGEVKVDTTEGFTICMMNVFIW